MQAARPGELDDTRIGQAARAVSSIKHVGDLQNAANTILC